jgi:hypothetical protein
MSKGNVVLTVVSLAALGLLALGSPALAKDGDVRVRGTCTGNSASKLKLSAENGRIEVEFEVDQNRNGVGWTVVLTRDGTRVATLKRVTRAPSGSFSANRLLVNPAGANIVRAKATRAGETCSARATFGG